MQKQRSETFQMMTTSEKLLAATLQQAIDTDEYLRRKAAVRKAPHPAGETLYEYVLGWLDLPTARAIREHLVFCETCMNEVARIMRIEHQLADKHEKIQKASPSDILSGGAFKEVLPEELATEYWEPQWAGQQVTAADIPRQEHWFFLEDGKLHIRCHWGAQEGPEPAYIWFAWKADLNREHVLYARFADPATQTIRCDIKLGGHFTGEEIFTPHELGFDPSSDRWALAIVFKEK